MAMSNLADEYYKEKSAAVESYHRCQDFARQGKWKEQDREYQRWVRHFNRATHLFERLVEE